MKWSPAPRSSRKSGNLVQPSALQVKLFASRRENGEILGHNKVGRGARRHSRIPDSNGRASGNSRHTVAWPNEAEI